LTQLVLATSVMTRFRGVPEHLINMHSFWRHGISAGLVARAMASINGEYNAERFFVGGLLHDVGRLVMCLKAPDQLRRAMELVQKGELLYKQERRVFGYDHADVGGELLRQWNLPFRLQESIRCHHKPQRATNYADEAALINLADAISHSLDLGNSGESGVPPLKEKSWELVGLDEETYLPQIQDKVRKQFDEVVQVFLHG